MTRLSTNLAAFALIVAGALTASAIVGRTLGSRANEYKLEPVRVVVPADPGHSELVDSVSLLSRKSPAISQLGRHRKIVPVRRLGRSVSSYLAQPISDLTQNLTHDGSLEREKADLRQLVTVDTTAVKNLVEDLLAELATTVASPPGEGCGRVCSIVLEIVGALAVIIAAAVR